MAKWADYCISQIKWNETQKSIIEMMVHSDIGDTIASGTERNRNWIVQKLCANNTFCTIQKNEAGKWYKTSDLKLVDSSLKWNDNDLPLIQTHRKTFVSYFHADDQTYKENFLNLTDDLIVNKSVEDGDISTDISTEYIKQLIQNGFLSDTTVLVVLIGNNTKHRKHVDWEISGALNYKVGDNYAGLLGLKLPNHPDFNTGKTTYDLMPTRLADNFKSGYAIIRDYTANRKKIQEYIELAFNNRTQKADSRINSRAQMQRNTN